MEKTTERLYLELKEMKKELIEGLKNKNCSPLIAPLIKEEIQDVEEAMKKIENGTFGLCELSGEFIPESYLYSLPTIKSKKDIEQLQQFYCKSLRIEQNEVFSN